MHIRLLSTLKWRDDRERKNVNLPGVVVDLPTLTAKDEDDLVHWGLPNDIDFIAASFVRKGSDLDYIRKVCSAPSVSCMSGNLTMAFRGGKGNMNQHWHWLKQCSFATNRVIGRIFFCCCLAGTWAQGAFHQDHQQGGESGGPAELQGHPGKERCHHGGAW